MLLLLFFRVCLSSCLPLFLLHLTSAYTYALVFPLVTSFPFFSMVRAQGWSYGALPAAWSRGALSGVAALCVACVSVVVSVNSYVLVRAFHLGSWGGGPLVFREPAELQSPMKAAAPPSQLFHCLSALDIEEQPTPPSLTLLPVGRAMVASSALPEGSSQGLMSAWKNPYFGILFWGTLQGTASTTPPINGKRCGYCPSTSKRCRWLVALLPGSGKRRCNSWQRSRLWKHAGRKHRVYGCTRRQDLLAKRPTPYPSHIQRQSP